MRKCSKFNKHTANTQQNIVDPDQSVCTNDIAELVKVLVCLSSCVQCCFLFCLENEPQLFKWPARN